MNHSEIIPVVCGAYEENAYLVAPEGRADAFCVDPGDGLTALERALTQSGRTLSAILLTHGHFDHILAAKPLAERTGAKVYISSLDDELLSDSGKAAYDACVSSLPMPENLPRAHFGEELDVCGVALKILATPGHTAGSVCLYDEAGGILFSGDTLFRMGYGRTDLFSGDDGAMVSTLTHLLTALPAETRVYPGHGDMTTIGRERARYRL